jgi:hypothetical protein
MLQQRLRLRACSLKTYRLAAEVGYVILPA